MNTSSSGVMISCTLLTVINYVTGIQGVCCHVHEWHNSISVHAQPAGARLVLVLQRAQQQAVIRDRQPALPLRVWVQIVQVDEPLQLLHIEAAKVLVSAEVLPR